MWAGDSEEPFQIGSVIKVFTSLLLATYVADGSLRLDDRVDQLVPELAGIEVGGATSEQLATHTSGLPRIPRELWRRALTRHPDPMPTSTTIAWSRPSRGPGRGRRVEPPGNHPCRGGPDDRTWHFVALAGAGALVDARRPAPVPGRPARASCRCELGTTVRLTHEVRVPGRRLDQCLGWLRLRGRD